MKSFTRSQPNVQALRSDKRFDALLRKQEEEHQHIISSHHKEMQALRDNLNLSMEKFKSLSDRNEQDLKEFKEWCTAHLCLIKDKMIANDATITAQKKTIDDLHQLLMCFQMAYAKNSDLETLKKSLSERVKEATTGYLNSFQDLQRQLKIDLSILKDSLDKLTEEADRRLSEQSSRIETRFKENKLDREGVLREIRIYEKTIFIIEKKIENIYTLIERMKNKKDEE